jgi:3-carboxy-cis,cis-muconate cycloisomerase
MAATPFESAVYRELLCDAEVSERFSDNAEIAAWLRVEAALAKAQGSLGLIPADSSAEIAKACGEIELEPSKLAAGTGRDGIPIPAFLAELRAVLDVTHASYLHFGATTQDIMDTGLVLRLGEVCDIFEARSKLLLHALADLAETHADLPVAARTRRMPATPTSFGALAAAWGAPLLAECEALAQLRPRLRRASLAGASGNAAALGPRSGELRAAFARELGLDPGESCWHTDRSALARFTSLLTRICAALAKIAEDCLLGSTPEVGELRFAGGGSSTMPHKQNPVQAETLASLFQLAAALDGAMTQALVHRQQRDGAAWTLEWHLLPQICIATGRALQLGLRLLAGLEVDPARMRANLDGAHGLVYAEAISFRLAAEMPRPDAQALVKAWCADAIAGDRSLAELAAERFPAIDWGEAADPLAQLGDAPVQAREFAARARNLNRVTDGGQG